MAVQILIQMSGAGGTAGTKEDPFQSGGIYFQTAMSGDYSSVKLIWQHKWIVGGQPIPENLETPEMWYGRDGDGTSPNFHPTRKTTLSMVRFTVWNQGYEAWPATIDAWVMAAADEPVPMFGIQCDDGIQQVNKEELDWLKANGMVDMVVPRPVFHGTRLQLRETLENREPVDPPTEPIDIHPDAKVSLQICYAPIVGYDYEVNEKQMRHPGDDIRDMKMLGARMVMLWVYPEHLFHGTNSWDKLNDCVLWYAAFIQICKQEGLKVALKMPMWGMPSWYDSQGIPERGTQKYRDHIDAKKRIIAMVNEWLKDADFVVMGTEPQLTCSKYPYSPGKEAPRWSPAEILEITRDVVKLAPLYTNLQPVGPALSGAVGQVLPVGEYMEVEEFLTGLVVDMAKAGVEWCGINAYQLDAFRVPTYENYGRFYENLSKIYPLFPSEMGVARKNVPSDSGLKAHLEAMIEQAVVFSPQLFSYFIYRDFNEHGWGLVRQDGTLDVRREVLAKWFGEGAVVPAYSEVLPARVRADEKIDCGVQLMQRGWESVEVHIQFWKSLGRWDHDLGDFVDVEKSGVMVGEKVIDLGPANPVAFNVWRDLGFEEVDAVVILSEEDLGTVAMWVWPKDYEANFAGFPAMS